MTYDTREQWLQAFIDASRTQFDAVGAPIPPNVRAAVGFTSKGMKGNRIAECWADTSSADGHFEIFLKPTIVSTHEICAAFTHELIHASVGMDKGHNAVFKRVATSLGLTGKMTATVPSEAWFTWAGPIMKNLGTMPYGAISEEGKSTGRKPQIAALLKMECPACGFLARVTKKHIEPHSHLNCPVPDCEGELLREEAGE